MYRRPPVFGPRSFGTLRHVNPTACPAPSVATVSGMYRRPPVFGPRSFARLATVSPTASLADRTEDLVVVVVPIPATVSACLGTPGRSGLAAFATTRSEVLAELLRRGTATDVEPSGA